MPYTAEEAKKRLLRTYKNVSDTAARQFAHVWNTVFDEHGDEARAFSTAYGVLKRRGLLRKASSSPIRQLVLALTVDKRAALEHPAPAEAPPVPTSPPGPAPAKPEAPPVDYEKSAREISELTGGIPRVYTADSLLIEDAGPGLHIHVSHHGEVLSLEAGTAHPDQLQSWMERVTDAFGARAATKEIDFQKVAGDPKALALFLEALFKSQKLAATSLNSKVSVGSRRDVTKVLQSLFGEHVRSLFQRYFGESSGLDTDRVGA